MEPLTLCMHGWSFSEKKLVRQNAMSTNGDPWNVENLANKNLTRALEGGAKNAHPSGFSRIAGKRRRAAPPFFQYLITIEFDTLCKNFSPRSPKVRSPGQVKVKNGFLTLRLRSGHTRYPIGVKPSAFHKVIDTYNLYISDFLYLSPEVRSIS